jgi:hypothetical protein
MISWRNVQQNTARNDRIIDNMVICRTFMRSVLSWGVDRQWTVTERSRKYRPPIDRVGMWRFAGLSAT